MKKLFISFNLLVLVLLISSCGDIINPEPDTHTTPIKYHSVLKDQEHSVIMPLKVGYYWVYRVTSFNPDGSSESISYDTTFVKKDTLIDGCKWFILSDPGATDWVIYRCLTNTDIGLCSNGSKCLGSLLRAEYPVKHKTYLYCDEEYPTQVRYYDDDGNLIDQRIVYATTNLWIDIQKISGYSLFYNSFDCFKYIMWVELKAETKVQFAKDYPSANEYFIPNIGLVRKEYCTSDSLRNLKMYRLRELIYTNVKI
ncbi:MAG: hypothetical protein WCR42_04965 [bacterium]